MREYFVHVKFRINANSVHHAIMIIKRFLFNKGVVDSDDTYGYIDVWGEDGDN
jgi:hypothetical protein